MYEILTLKSNIRIPPRPEEQSLEEAIRMKIHEDFIGKIIEGKSLLIGLISVDSREEGIIIPEDPSVYYPSTFKVLGYTPNLHETVRGQVVNISEIGATVNIGPVDGLAFISQTMDDYVDFSKNALVGRKTKETIKVGDTVIASVIAITTKGQMKVGLTMRSPGLGKIDRKKSAKGKAAKENKGGNRNG
ncbi:MAG: DNA-directed RNA polymerase [Candidatus Parvarchaeota archaeon]|nr:DNA-directed RNA polymerase [Candidatus Parvarchaeota archaeon]MCW1301980.1 DNA-directed RNA polymerase [Candidatus Parvarchaeota archaeon]